jgi:hypothetical protein
VSRMLKLLVWVVALAVLPAASSAADTPTKTTTTAEFTTVVDNVCDFPITIQSTLTTTAITLTDESGSPQLLQLHVVEQDVFSANGVSLTSTPYTFNQQIVFDPAGTAVHAYASGEVVRIPLPDGSVFFSAGRLDFVTFGGQYAVTPQVGLSGDTSALCAALAG